MHIFKLDASPETARTAPVVAENLLKTLVGLVARPRAFGAGDNGCFSGLSMQDMASTCWLGHADKQGIGDYTSAGAFVKKFNNEFEKEFASSEKNKVQHVYIIGCETGLIDSGSTPMAQQIADKLHDKGFKSVKVHAVANPPQPDTSMIVKIVSHPQPPAFLSGDMQAVLLNAEQAAQYHQLTVSIANSTGMARCKLQDQRENLEKQGIVFLHTSNILGELDRPHNTFIPNQPNLRPVKLLQQEQALLTVEDAIRQEAFMSSCRGRERALKFLGKMRPGNQENKLENLHRLRDEIRNCECKEDTWLTNLTRWQSHFRMSKGCQVLLGSFIAKANVTTQSGFHMAAAAAASSVVATGGLVLSGCSSRLYAPPAKSEMPPAMRTAKRRIDHHVEVLEEEKRSSWFPSEIKDYKIRQLKALSQNIQGAYERNSARPEWLAFIEAAIRDDKLVQGVMQHRTYDLLCRIRDENRPSDRTALMARR